MRRLSIRLTLVAAVVIIGTVAIVQSKMMGNKTAKAKEENEPEKKKPPAPIKAPGTLNTGDSSLFPDDTNPVVKTDGGLGSNTGFEGQRVQAVVPTDKTYTGGGRNSGFSDQTGQTKNLAGGGGGIPLDSTYNSKQKSSRITIDDNNSSSPVGGRLTDQSAGGRGSLQDAVGGRLRDTTNSAGKSGVGEQIGIGDQTNTGQSRIQVPNTINNQAIQGGGQSGRISDQTNKSVAVGGGQSGYGGAGTTDNKQLQIRQDNTKTDSGQIDDRNIGQGFDRTKGAAGGSIGKTNDAVGREPIGRAPGLIGGATSTATQLSATPGPRELEGAQTPAVSIQKTAPTEIQVDKPATFYVTVRNTGKVATHRVTVIDRVPQGTKFIEASDNAAKSGDSIIWDLGTLEPGEQRKLSVKLLPEIEGEIGSTAQVVFQAKATVRTKCTKPKLTFTHTPLNNRVLAGNEVVFDITISNGGTGAATGLKLLEDVPAGLSHPSGPKLDNAIGVLRPGETRKLQLKLIAEKAGPVLNKMTLRGDGNLVVDSTSRIEVVSPGLELFVRGPKVRYLNRQGTYRVQVTNPGTAAADNVTFTTKLPAHVRFVSANRFGKYDPKAHKVRWSLEELPPGKTAEAELVLTASRTGKGNLTALGTADRNLKAQKFELPVSVRAIAELQFTIDDTSDPVEVGDATTYRIRIKNIGSKTATNVEAAADMPLGIKPASISGQRRGTIVGQRVKFQTIPNIAPKQEVTFTIKAQGTQVGDHVIKVIVRSDESRTAVTAEERTRVYSDQ